ncbi:hypothetical protein BDZ89DRAFT_1132736 [Hymenopellis radicata]|nr:hypothetical protein BDZ89DRAFT_1132736 [Hymenopellis radicata]
MVMLKVRSITRHTGRTPGRNGTVDANTSDDRTSSPDSDDIGEEALADEIGMLEAHAEQVRRGQATPDRRGEDAFSESLGLTDFERFLSDLEEIIASPPDADLVYQKVKKDIFHTFNMIPTSVHHGLRPGFLRALRDHLMRWDPNIRELVHEVCQQNFNCSFETMLARNPRWIADRCPRHIPAPSILVRALEFVFGVFGHGTNARSGDPLFNHTAWQKAHAVLQLAREGYLSDNEGVILYEEAGVDQYGLRKYDCSRGTNKVEGGPHADIYRKFGALHAGPRYTVNSLTDHWTFYNLQAYAKHMFGLDWKYHHS